MMDPSSDVQLIAVDFSQLPGWTQDDPSTLWPAMADCLQRISGIKPYRTGSLGLTSTDLRPLLERAAAETPQSAQQARQFFETHCQVFRLRGGNGQNGLVTAFYEPDVAVSDHPDSVFRFPFYRRPMDLVDLDDTNRPEDIDRSYAFGRRMEDRITPYLDRREIDQGYLEGKGLEIAWAKSRVDVFFAHVQGAARLRYSDGRIARITYDAKTGHPFSAIGRHLIELGEIERERISMQAIRSWLAENPARHNEILWHNRSYIFFREVPPGDLTRGPVAAAKVQLVAGRSLAVDRQIHTFGFPFFIHAPDLKNLDSGRGFARLMLALDTGSAIVGAARGDIFTGSGEAAGNLAGAVKNVADFYILVPKQAAGRFV